MTESKAIELLEYIRETGNGEAPYVGCTQNIAIEMATNALEKQIAKKPDRWESGYACCCSCKRGIVREDNYCCYCGQKIDFGE